MSDHTRHLVALIGQPVRVDLDTGSVPATLLSIGRNGCRVQFAHGKTRVVAWWRIGRDLDALRERTQKEFNDAARRAAVRLAARDAGRAA